MTAVSYQNKLLSSPQTPSPATPTPAFSLSFFFLCVGIVVDKVQAEVESDFFIAPFFFLLFFADQLRLFVHLLTSGLHIWNGSWLEKEKKKGTNQKTVANGATSWLVYSWKRLACVVFTHLTLSGSQDVRKTNIGQHDKYALWFYSWLCDKFPAVTCGRGKVDH